MKRRLSRRFRRVGAIIKRKMAGAIASRMSDSHPPSPNGHRPVRPQAAEAADPSKAATIASIASFKCVETRAIAALIPAAAIPAV